MSELSRDFKGIWITKEIWCDSSLSLLEKCLFAEINSLDGQDGCYASNEYLCKFLNCKERNLQMALSALKTRGYISVESFDGRIRILRSHVKTIYEKLCTSGVQKNAPLPCKKMHPSPKEHTYIESKEKKKAAASAAAFFPCLDKTPLSQTDKIKLSKKYTEADLMQAVEWMATKSNVENYAAYLNKGLQILAQGENLEISKPPQERAEDNRTKAEQIAKKWKLPNGVYVECLHQHVEVGKSPYQPICIPYTENGFENQLENAIRKYGGNAIMV